MKKVLPHPEPPTARTMWRSLNELAGDPSFDQWLHREFPAGAAEWQGGELSRRNFLRLMGASMALAGLGLNGCRRPEAYLVPFTGGVEWTIPGKFLYYATSQPRRQGAMPLLATTSDGRPVKLEGNPLHPVSNGGTDVFAQASVLDLYDPNRSRDFKAAGQLTDAAALQAELQAVRTAAAADGGAGLAFLVQRLHSPTRDRQQKELLAAFPQALWAEYEPLGDDQARTASAAAFGPGINLLPDFTKADKVLALDSDFLNPSFSSLDQVRGFVSRRRVSAPGQPMNRLYVVENRYTATGGMADHRLRLKASHIGAFARALGVEVAGLTGDGDLNAALAAFPESAVPADPVWIRECAKDLAASRGRSLVVIGEHQPAPVQALVHAINKALGAPGSTLLGYAAPATPPASSIGDLCAAMQAGRVKTLFILGGNPVYNAPADLRFGDLLKGVMKIIRLGYYEDETSALAGWHIPQAHYLETWGDARSPDGTVCAVQPMVLPLWNGVSEIEILETLLGRPPAIGPQTVRTTFAQLATGSAGNLETAWSEFLRCGFLAGSSSLPVPLTFRAAEAARLLATHQVPAADGWELVFTPGSSVDDGRYANNGWLQETPDLVTKLTWDNALLLSPASAKILGVKDGDLVEVATASGKMEAGVQVAPGHADESLSIALGYGQAHPGYVAAGAGFNAYPLRVSSHPLFVNGVSVRPLGRVYPFAHTQEHHSMEGRDLVREGTLERFREFPDFARTMGMDGHIPPNISLFTHPKLDSPEQWGMAVDLNTCVGCNACLVACQAENNVPIVGKEQVIKGRDMAWIRMDRYFASPDGSPDDPEMLTQAIMCQHCENAPCETVCPVNATVHSEDGLNLMAYNRCIGTRYCANNCPWKVRRFNYFDYNQRPLDQLYHGPLARKGMAESLQMLKNPNVTVRMRGVMEKCTYCIQRIEEAKITRTVKAGASDKLQVPFPEVKSACQQACPAEAIVFGNINDPESRVAKLKAEARNYEMLKYLNVSPRTTYLARIKNPNMAMPGADKVGWANGLPHHGHQEHQPEGHDPAHAAPHGT